MLFLRPDKQDMDVTVVRGKQDLRIQGPRLNHTKEDKMMVRRGLDQRLSPIIMPPMPLMEVRLAPRDDSEGFGRLKALYLKGPHPLYISTHYLSVVPQYMILMPILLQSQSALQQVLLLYSRRLLILVGRAQWFCAT